MFLPATILVFWVVLAGLIFEILSDKLTKARLKIENIEGNQKRVRNKLSLKINNEIEYFDCDSMVYISHPMVKKVLFT